MRLEWSTEHRRAWVRRVPRRVGRINSFARFDDEVTAPIHGFRDGRDYWTRSSSKPFLGRIRIPTFLVSAGDDPFLPAVHLPVREISESKWLTAAFTRTGGHVGFVQGNTPASATYWHEARIVDFLKRRLEF